MSTPFHAENDAFVRLLRQGAIAALEAELLHAVAELPETEPVRGLALSLDPDTLTVTGWEQMCANAVAL